MTILHINSSAQFTQSNTRIIGQYLVDRLKQPVIHRDLARDPLPPISAEDLLGVHGSSNSVRDSLKNQLRLSNQLITELNQAETVVFGVPLYNFGIPATLKQWIDAVCRAGVSFRYTSQGPVGLLNTKRAFIITASGGTPIGSGADFASRYLEHICRFIGIEDVFHIDACGSKGNPEQVIALGKKQADKLIATLCNNPVSMENA